MIGDSGIAGIRMRSKKKILIVLGILAILSTGFLVGTILYYYHHPAATKGLLERSLSRSVGASLRIRDLSYSLKPLSIRAKGIVVEPGQNQHGFYLEVPSIKADMTLLGRFGQKSLSFTNIAIPGFSFRLSEEMVLPEVFSKEGAPSRLQRVLREMMALFLFREIRLQAVEIVGGEIAFQLHDQNINVGEIEAGLSPDHRIHISCGVRAEWLQKKMSLAVPRLHVITDHAMSLVDLNIKGLLHAQEASFESADIDVHNMKLESALVYDHNLKRITFDSVDVRLERMILKEAAGREPVSRNLELKAKGFLDLQKNHAEIPEFYLVMGDLLDLNGELNLDFGTRSLAEITRLEGHLLAEEWLSLIRDKMGEALAPFSLSGPIGLRASLKGTKVGSGWQWHGNAEVQLTKNRFSHSTKETELEGRVTAEIKVAGQFPDMNLSVALDVDDAVFSGKGVALMPSRATLVFSGKHPVYLIGRVNIQMPQIAVVVGEKQVRIHDLQVRLRDGNIHAEKRLVALPEVSLTSSLLKDLHLSLSADEEKAIIELKGRETRLLESARALDLLPPGWEFSGLDDLQINAVLKKNQQGTVTTRLNFTNLGFQDQDAAYMGEGIDVSAETDVDIDLKQSGVSGHGALRIQGGEILFDKFYLDLGKNPLSASLKGRYEAQKKSLQLSSLRLGFKDILNFAMNGMVLGEGESLSVNLSMDVEETPLKPIFHHFILEPFKTQKPSLASLQIDGKMTADVRLKGSRTDLYARGSVRWRQGGLSSSDQSFSLQGIDLELPFWYQSREAAGHDERIHGRLFIQSTVFPLLPEQSFDIPLEVGPNRLSVTSPTFVRIEGGNLQVGPVACKDIYSRPSVRTSLTVGEIQIDPLLSGVWSSPMQGSIAGKLDPVLFEGDTLSSGGEIRVDALNGELVLSGIGVSNLFSSGPVFKVDAEWNNLNLAELTTGTTFGKIEGILQGHVKGLEVAYGQPQAFDLWLETVKQKGVPQKISIKAIENIAQIGGGQSPFMGLAGGIAALFKEFPYEKIGVHSTLENDVFRINGTVREGGTEYLVKRGGFSGVNIVNQNPDNRVGFKDMVKRMKRVTASKSGPVVQ